MVSSSERENFLFNKTNNSHISIQLKTTMKFLRGGLNRSAARAGHDNGHCGRQAESGLRDLTFSSRRKLPVFGQPPIVHAASRHRDVAAQAVVLELASRVSGLARTPKCRLLDFQSPIWDPPAVGITATSFKLRANALGEPRSDSLSDQTVSAVIGPWK